MMKVINVVGARPNFMKMAPIVEAMNQRPGSFQHCLVHTGQHYDGRMSGQFFTDLAIPKPDIDLNVGSGSHAQQTASVMMAFETVCLDIRPELVIVVGDVNSTLACAVTAKKLGIKVAHVEAGLRSHDMAMPEEINRLCTDVLSDYLFTTDEIARKNLLMAGLPEDNIHFVGNVMIDTLLKCLPRASNLPLLDKYGLKPRVYALLTLHRPSNVDNPQILGNIIGALADIARDLPVVFPIHPRTRKMVEEFGYIDHFSTGLPVRGIWMTEPLGYLEFLHLHMNAAMLLTDSGGLQEESTVLDVPCITLRGNTERPITCVQGTNRIVGNDPQAIVAAAKAALSGGWIHGRRPDKWDGHTAERIVDILSRVESTGVAGAEARA